MLQIEDKIVSLDVLEKKFLCDISMCLGECCVDGDSGAPLEKEEIDILKNLLPIVWNDLSEKSKKVIEKQGVSYIDIEGEPVTSIVSNGECVFTYFDEKGICKCAIEKAYREGKTDFYKPVSCHLYPIRTPKYRNFTAVNYHQWEVCGAARALGKEKGVAVYQFLKEPLIRKFGAEWYAQLEIAARELQILERK
ncbi:hypothetical protein FACS189434_06360 [Bacteroidia bacterium]|nr:hypothetical protein FACS189434_06360 [Bacteroidia bacterium]